MSSEDGRLSKDLVNAKQFSFPYSLSATEQGRTAGWTAFVDDLNTYLDGDGFAYLKGDGSIDCSDGGIIVVGGSKRIESITLSSGVRSLKTSTIFFKTDCPDEPIGKKKDLVDLENVNDQFGVYPNPARDHFTVEMNGVSKQDLSIQIIDQSGKVLQSNEFTAVKGFNKFDLSSGSLTPGIYLIKVATEERVMTNKLLIIK